MSVPRGTVEPASMSLLACPLETACCYYFIATQATGNTFLRTLSPAHPTVPLRMPSYPHHVVSLPSYPCGPFHCGCQASLPPQGLMRCHAMPCHAMSCHAMPGPWRVVATAPYGREIAFEGSTPPMQVQTRERHAKYTTSTRTHNIMSSTHTHTRARITRTYRHNMHICGKVVLNWDGIVYTTVYDTAVSKNQEALSTECESGNPQFDVPP